jgi:hypothetical protein
MIVVRSSLRGVAVLRRRNTATNLESFVIKLSFA